MANGLGYHNKMMMMIRTTTSYFPRLSWRREDNKPIEYGNWQANKELLGFEYRMNDLNGPTNWQGTNLPNLTLFLFTAASSFDGESITINKVSRIHMAAYLCIAQNGKLSPEDPEAVSFFFFLLFRSSAIRLTSNPSSSAL